MIFFGHIFINASIYMAAIAVYEIIPDYTGRCWKTTRLFVIAWLSVLLFVMTVYPHHLLQDMVMPGWMLVMGQIVSYLSGIPLLAVTAFSLCLYLRGSGMRWDLASALLVCFAHIGSPGRYRIYHPDPQSGGRVIWTSGHHPALLRRW